MKKKIILLAVSLALSLLVLEIGVRIISPPSLFSPLLPLHPHMKLELETNLRGVSPHGKHTTNKWGLRGDEPPRDWTNRFTILTIGGSTTYCHYLDDAKTWAAQLQANLKPARPDVWVGNAGMDGQSTRGHLVAMDELVAKIRPNMVVFLAGINDLGLSLNDTARAQGNQFDNATWWRNNWKVKLYSASRLVQIAHAWKQVLAKEAKTVRAAHQTWEPQPIVNPTPLPADLRELLPQLPEFTNNVRALIARSRALGITPVFLTQPMLPAGDAQWDQYGGQFAWIAQKQLNISAATQWKLLDLYNAELKSVCTAEGVACLDLAAAIPHDTQYFYDQCHFTEVGAELVGRTVASFITSGVLEKVKSP